MSLEVKKITSCGVRTHASLRLVVLKTTPLDRSGKLVWVITQRQVSTLKPNKIK